MKFPGVSKKEYVEISGVNQKISGISSNVKKNSCGIPWMDLGFELGISKGCHTILQIFHG